VNFLRTPTIRCQTIIGRGRLIHATKSLGLSEATIEDGRGRLLGHATSRCVVYHLDPRSWRPALMRSDRRRARLARQVWLRSGHASRLDIAIKTIRQLAADLGLAGGTVARAYRELEQGGFILSRGRKGTSVAARPAATRQDRERAMIDAANAFAAQAVRAGVDPRQALDRTLAGSSPTNRTRT
jgi:DNA-binding transcriptional regulator YhcF (GntR family)